MNSRTTYCPQYKHVEVDDDEDGQHGAENARPSKGKCTDVVGPGADDPPGNGRSNQAAREVCGQRQGKRLRVVPVKQCERQLFIYRSGALTWAPR